MTTISISRGRPSRILQVILVLALLTAQGAVMLSGDRAPRAVAQSIAQIHYTPFEAQTYIEVLRSIAGDPACCNGPVNVSVSITSGADANLIVYDHFEDGYEVDPFDPQQPSTITLTLDKGEVWSRTSSVPVDPRGAGFYFDGRDKVVSSAPIAMTQTGYADDPGTVHAGGVQVMDLDKSGTQFRVPIGQDADHLEVFEYVGLLLVGSAAGTVVDIDADADGTAETTLTIGEGEVHVVDGGVNLGATVTSSAEVAVYLASGDIGATYEGRFIELFPTRAWTDAYISPVGARDAGDDDATRVFVFNPGTSAITVDVTESGGGTGSVAVPAGGQASYRMPVDSGARFSSADGSPFYALQAITTDGASTSAFDWGFTLIPEAAATPSVVVPYAPGSAGLTNNYSPVWVAASAATTIYVDRDGDPATGSATDPRGSLYDFSCAVAAYESVTIYDDGTTTCYAPSQNAGSGGDRDLTGAHIYTVDGTRLSAAWGQRSNYTPGTPALDMGTTILPYPALLIAKSAVVSGDVDGDGEADPGDTLTYTVTLVNEGIVDVDNVTIYDEVPDTTTYVSGSTVLDGAAQSDDPSPFSAFPADADSPDGLFSVGTILAGETRELSYSMRIDDPVPAGVTTIRNRAIVGSEYGESTVIVIVRLDLAFQITKWSSPPVSPVGAGGTIPYTVQVFNGETVTHTNVVVSDTIPTATSYVAGSVAADVDGIPVAAAGPPDLVSGLNLEPGAVLTITYEVVADASLPAGITEFVNVASATSDQQPDPVTDDAVDPAGPAVDLSVAKTDGDPGTLRPGDAFTYTVTVTNAGPDVADDVIVVDTLPAGVTLDPVGTDPSCAEAPAGTVTCAIGDLAVGSTSVDIAVVIDAGVDGTLINEVTVASSSPEGYPGDETAYEDTLVDALPEIAVSKSAAPNAIPEPGGVVTFSVTVDNPTTESLTLTELTDDVFGDLLDPDNPEVSANTCPTRPMTIAPGATFGCSFDADLDGSPGGPVHLNTVSASVLDDEGNAASDSDSATVMFIDAVPTLDLVKTADPSVLDEPGGTVTFTVEISNTSVETVTLTDLTDDVFGDLLDGSNPAVSANTCAAAASAALAPAAVLTCSFDATVGGDASGPDHVDVVTATVVDDEANEVSASDAATVTFNDVAPSITVAKTPTPGSLPEPGGTVTFTVEVVNTSAEEVTLTGLSDDIFGDLLDISNPLVAFNDCPAQAVTIGGGATFTCDFDAALTGDSADPAHVDTVTAIVADDDGNTATASGSATVAFTDILPEITVAKSADPGSVSEPGAMVTFGVSVTNITTETVDLTGLTDDVFGDLLDSGNPAVSSNTCPGLPTSLAGGAVFSCSFAASIAGTAAGPDHVNTVTATVADDDGNIVSESDDAVVAFDDVAPSISVTKTPSTASLGEPGGTVTFSIEVDNTSVEEVTLTALDDDEFGNLLDAGNAAVSANTCVSEPRAIPAGGIHACSFAAHLDADPTGPDHANTVTATAVDDEGNAASDSDSAMVVFVDDLPAIAVSKVAAPGAVAEPGGMVTFAVTIENLSHAEAILIGSIDDDVFGDLLDAANPDVSANTCPGLTAVGAGSTGSCSFQAFVPADASGPNHSDTVTVSGSDDEGNSTTAAATATVSFIDTPPSVEVTKNADRGSVPEPGGPVMFTIVVDNTSHEAVVVVSLVDDVFGDLLDPGNPATTANDCATASTSIPAGRSLTCSFTADVTGDAAGSGHINTVTVVVADGEGSTASDADSASVGIADVAPTIIITKSADPGSVTEPGEIVTFTVAVANTSNEPVTVVSLVDDLFGDLLDPGNPAVSASTCPSADRMLAAGETAACTFDAFVTGSFGDPDHRNTVTATVVDNEGTAGSATDSATVGVGDAPSIVVSKTPSTGSVTEPGGTVVFVIEVANTSTVNVTITSLTDDVFGDLLDASNPAIESGDCPAQSASIGPGETMACSFVAELAGDASGADHTNTITAAVVDALGNAASDTASATVTFTDVEPTITVDKQASVLSVTEPGGPVTFTVTVTNTSPEDVTITSITDDVFGDLSDASNSSLGASTCPAILGSLGAGDSATCSFSVVLAANAADGDHVDTVTVTARDDDGNTVTESDDARVGVVDAIPSIVLSKTASPTTVPEPGGTVRFTVVLDNDGVEPITVVSLTDDVFGDLLDPYSGGLVANTCATAVLQIPAGGTLTCAFDAALAGHAGDPDHHDTVTATAVDDEGTEVTQSDSATVAFGAVETLLTGHVFVDDDGDGVQGPTEPDLPGVGVMVIDGAGTTTTVTSDESGDWSVMVRSGTATIRVQSHTVPSGYLLTTANALQAVDVSPGVQAASEDVGYRPGDASVRGTVWVDLDGDDGIDDREPALEGVRIWAMSADGVPVGQATTDASGAYRIDGLRPGEVTLRLDGTTVPGGLEPSWDADGDADRTILVSLGAAETRSDLDFAERGVGIIGDFVWVDADGNGRIDGGEEPLQGVAVALLWAGFDGEFDTDDDVDFGERASGADGQYRFAALPPGAYRVSAALSTAGLGMQATTDLVVVRSLAAGDEELTVDFGFVSKEELPNTGYDLAPMLALAGALIAAGTALVFGSSGWARRRRPTYRRIRR